MFREFWSSFRAYPIWRQLLFVAGLLFVLGYLALALPLQVYIHREERRASEAFERASALVRTNWGGITSAELAPPPVIDGENKARLTRAAVDALVYDPEERELLAEVRSDSDAGLPSETLTGLESVFRRNRVVFAILDELDSRKLSNWELAGKEPSLDLSGRLGDLRRLVVKHALVNLRQRQVTEALRDINRGLAVAESLASEPDPVFQSTRMTLHRETLGVLRDLLSRSELPARDLRLLLARLDRLSDPDPLVQGLKGWMLGCTEWGAQSQEGKAAAEGLQSWILKTPFYGRLCAARLRQEMSEYLLMVDRVLHEMTKPPYQREAPQRDYFEEWSRQNPIASTLVGVSMYALSDITIEPAEQFRARQGLARTALALRLYRMERGTYPSTLAELVPGYLDEVPLDPLTGSPFPYERMGAGFRLRCPDERSPSAESGEEDPVLEWDIPR